jgi:flagellin-like hook-associated protein FlgL
MISLADSALGQVGSLLNDIKGLVVEASNAGTMNADMIAANQMQIDAAIDAIDSIAKRTTYNGQKILDGSMDFRTSSTARTEDPNNIGISNLRVTNANFGTGQKVDVSVNVLEEAKKAQLIYYGSGTSQKTSFDVTGSIGTQSFNFGVNDTNEYIASEINKYADSTGVTAKVEGVASRGTITLSSVGANNDIVITANDVGFAAGDYTFEIVEGEVNDAQIVSAPNAERPGLVRITVQKSYSREYTNFADMFNINIDTDGPVANTSVSIRQGTHNSAVLNPEARNATGVTKDGIKTVQLTDAGTNGHISNANDWTFLMVDSTDERAGKFDDTGKFAYIEIGATPADTQTNLETAIERLTGGTAGTATVTIGGGGGLVVGDSFTLSGGAEAGELTITYKEGATAGDILKLINANTGVTATLLAGVSGTTLIKNLPKVPTRMEGTNAKLSALSSNVTAAQVVELFNSKLGHMFTAVMKSGDTGTGFVSFSDASVIYGDINLDNVLRFSGMDNGPIVRLTTTNNNGLPIANQQLGFLLRNPTETEIANGIHTKILEIKLATDSNGNSITTARDIVNLLNSATANQTGGVSASLVLPDGVDPNNRIWTVDGCFNETILENCESSFGNGIVQPTGVPGTCEMQENDLVLLGNNEQIIWTNATAYIKNSAPTTLVVAQTAVAGQTGTIGTASVAPYDIMLRTAEATNEYNGYSFKLDTSAASGGVGITYDATTKTFTVSGESTNDITAFNTALSAANLNTAINTATGTAGTFIYAVSILKSDGSGATGTDVPAFGTGSFTISGGLNVGDPLNGQKTQGYGRVVDENGAEHNFKTVNGQNTAFSIYSSALNGVTIAFDNTIASTDSTWDSKSGTLTVGINGFTGGNNATLASYITAATTKHGAAIKAYNGTALELIEFTSGRVSLLDSYGATGYTVNDIAALNGMRFTVGGGLGEGDVIESRAETGKIEFGTSGKQISMFTDKATSALNGISVNFTAEANLAGFDTATGALTVYLNPATQALTDNKQFEQAVQDAINASINMNWEQIRRFNDYNFSDPVTITLDLYDETYANPGIPTTYGSWLSATDLFSATTTDTSFGFPSTYSADTTTGAIRGLCVGDPALLISSTTLGQLGAGIKIVFEQDDSLQESTTERAYIEVSYDVRSDTEKVLTIRANGNALQNGTDGGINAALLAAALNADSTFSASFTARSPIWDNDALSEQTHAVIHFSNGTQFAVAETIGGWDITTNKNAIGLNQATSNGIAMTSNKDANERLVLEAAEYGSEHFVQVTVTSGDFKTYCPLGEELNYLAGTDVVATVNGQAANARGTNISINTTNLSMSMNVQNKYGYTSFSINGGGALFQLGPNVVSSQQMRLGIGSIISSRLGGTSGTLSQLKSQGDADISKSEHARVLADAIINETINYVSTLRGRLGAIQRSSLEPNVSMLQDTLTSLTEAEAQISNADFAEESSNLTKYQLLLQSGMQTLGIAKSLPQYAAQLLQM